MNARMDDVGGLIRNLQSLKYWQDTWQPVLTHSSRTCVASCRSVATSLLPCSSSTCLSRAILAACSASLCASRSVLWAAAEAAAAERGPLEAAAAAPALVTELVTAARLRRAVGFLPGAVEALRAVAARLTVTLLLVVNPRVVLAPAAAVAGRLLGCAADGGGARFRGSGRCAGAGNEAFITAAGRSDGAASRLAGAGSLLVLLPAAGGSLATTIDDKCQI